MLSLWCSKKEVHDRPRTALLQPSRSCGEVAMAFPVACSLLEFRFPTSGRSHDWEGARVRLSVWLMLRIASLSHCCEKRAINGRVSQVIPIIDALAPF